MKGCDCEKWKEAADLGVFYQAPGQDRVFRPWYEVWAEDRPELSFTYCPFCGAELKEEKE